MPSSFLGAVRCGSALPVICRTDKSKRDWAMPFTPYRSILDPEALEAAQVAFDMAWAEIDKTPGDQDMKLRDLLAKLIVELVVRG